MKHRRNTSSAEDQIPEPNRDVQVVSVSDLKPYDRNARTHSAKQIGQIAARIRDTGFLGSILVVASGTIIAGHGHLEAVISLDMPEVPVTRISHLTDAQVRANACLGIAGVAGPFQPQNAVWRVGHRGLSCFLIDRSG